MTKDCNNHNKCMGDYQIFSHKTKGEDQLRSTICYFRPSSGYPYPSRHFLTAESTNARGWMVSRFPRGICKIRVVASGTTCTIREPLSTRRTVSSKGWALPSDSVGRAKRRKRQVYAYVVCDRESVSCPLPTRGYLYSKIIHL